jgi:ABC-type antimicrobial peptide transport system ATPase subunit
MTQKNITVYYQKDWNPYAKYTEDFSKTHTKVFEGTITNVENQEDVFSAFNNDYANPLSYTNETNQVCVIGKNYGTGKDFQKAMKAGLVDCHHTSMSVGDIVEIDGDCFLCQDFGWKKFKKKEVA